MKLRVTHLYPRRMNIYGDRGNILSLARRAEWRGIDVDVTACEVGDPLPKHTDVWFFGGGQDQEQVTVAGDLGRISEDLRASLDAGAALLAVCGGYQLLGRYYQPADDERIEGVGIFPAYTEAGPTRLIGNVVAGCTLEGVGQPLVGFENHSGLTFLDEGSAPLARVSRGYGNNGRDGAEGCVVGNAVGTYLHGSLLPKNPQLTDWLIARALGEELAPLDDTLESAANQVAATRPA
jgi:lipid II isoglutaminyl synthase (glutamine-hydrolysing)